ncbi:MAG: hypothetical protein JNG84_01495 [Archangium sp.]|nr:hypothetical protein [Archangium sp.]
MRVQISWLAVVSAVALSACQCGKVPPTAAVLLKEGVNCIRDDECETALCDSVPGTQAVCVRKCADGCKSDEVCTQLTLGRYSCAKDKGKLCETCMLDADCPYPADKCLLVDGKGVCGRDCAFDQKCPTSYRCLNGTGTDGRAKAQQCSPASGSCSCTAATAGQAVSCTVMNTFGTCTGMRTCDGMSGFGACNARTASRELCNGMDDDCDGTIDEDGLNLNVDVMNCGACNNVCTLANATPRCSTGACAVAQCATNFGNCDMNDANGCEAPLLTDPNNCNACMNRCSAPGGVSTCMNGMCAYTCQPGFFDVDGIATNGCECTVPDGGTLVDLPDMSFTDTNCDGIDGEVNNGIFVSVLTGDDSNPGTMVSPVATIARGVQLARNDGKRDVYISQGNFNAALDLTGATGLNIVGGYAVGAAGARWTRSATNVTNVIGGNPALIMNGSNNVLIQLMQFRSSDANGTDAQRRGNSSYGARVTNTTGARFESVTIQAGRGADGLAGTNGNIGLPGSNGGNGESNSRNDSDIQCGATSAPRVPGTAGASSCGRTGGIGGTSGNTNNGSSGSYGGSGGTGLVGMSGGSGGTPTSLNHNVNSVANGENGTAAVDITTRSDGARLPQLGSLSAAGYLPPLTADGVDGSHANGGGGGGGGAGGCRKDRLTNSCICYTRGASGGGGGGGGCGGTKGTGGGSGGASIALMLYQSTVTASALSLRAGTGGNGTAGGRGGTGGTGGDPGLATYTDLNDTALTDSSGRGGHGGKGGKGGDGGHGAGGTGGPAFGVVRNSGSSINMSQVNATTGTAGQGGPGGNGTGSGNDGLPGLVATEQVL